VQTKRHARICSLMGIRYFVFAVNKMDLVSYSKETFDKILEQINRLTSELNLSHVKVIPVSATAGDNITVKSDNMPWYEGEPILSYLETVDIRKTEDEKGFYMPVQRVCRPNHTFRGFQGQIESGTIGKGSEITVLPSGETARVKSVLIGDKETDLAFTGQPVTITLDKEIDVSRGCVLTAYSQISVSKAFKATLLWMDDSVLSPGKEYIIKLGTKKIAGRVKKILYKTDVNSGKQLKTESITKNEIALCSILLDEEIPIDLFCNHKTLGELILIDRLTNMTSACGVVEEIDDDENENCAVIEGNAVKAKIYLFDEFFYNEKSLSVDNYSSEHKHFTLGDTIPLDGESYRYPSYFDILAIDSKAAVEIRDGIITAIKPLSEYRYTGLPVISGKGFSIGIHSSSEQEDFFRDMKTLEKQKLYEKWMKFETYRRVIFTNNFWGI
ncbi:MAG: GTP-binding protein, partial [Acutalibacteraceae bacterium]